MAKQRTHCAHGHELTEANTLLYRGHRRCRECNKAQLRKRYQRKRKRPKDPRAALARATEYVQLVSTASTFSLMDTSSCATLALTRLCDCGMPITRRARQCPSCASTGRTKPYKPRNRPEPEPVATTPEPVASPHCQPWRGSPNFPVLNMVYEQTFKERLPAGAKLITKCGKLCTNPDHLAVTMAPTH